MKQRVVGAIVLVALAVIFLPMLLDGSGRPGRVDLEVEIPEEPEAPASRLDDEPVAADAGAGTDAAAGPAQADASAPGEAAPDGDADPAAAGDDDAGDGGTAADAEAGDGTDADADSGAASGESSAWVVQVGSFVQETNALVLRDRLQQQGYEAFAEQGSSDGQELWRVRVGPVPTRERAESLKQRLEEQRGETALVMSHP